MPNAEHMFQLFGYGGLREWKNLSKGVAACLGMMKLIDNGKNAKWWREVRKAVVTGQVETQNGFPFPNRIKALLLDYSVPKD
jgi:hypothetical protein